MRDEVLQGDALEQLRLIPSGTVQCCVTSPPYWGLRDYGVHGQLGLEATPEEYVTNMVEVFREVRRVLRDDGTLWLNLGDSYAGYHGNSKVADDAAPSNKPGYVENMRKTTVGISGLKPKDLAGIPWMVAFALRSDGWYLRSDIIWAKGNVMPESIKDRPTKSHEYIFLLTKNQDYFYDSVAVLEEASGRVPGNRNPQKGAGEQGFEIRDGLAAQQKRWDFRNRRTVWSINPKPYRGAHFAVFPEKIPEVCIKAGTSEKGSCSTCGAPWERFQEGEGWKATCSCPAADLEPCIVLDPFAGSGTTLAVAAGLRRSYLGIELNPDYHKLIEERLAEPLLSRVQQDLFDELMGASLPEGS
jgi:DNA modification methylase